MEKIIINATLICQFDSFEDWVNNASWRLGKKAALKSTIVCIDKNNNSCFIGEDFMKARDNDLFPVKAYRLMRTIEA